MEDQTPKLDSKVLRQHRMTPAPGEHLPGAKPGEPEPDLSDIPEVSEDWFKKAKLKPPHPNTIARFEDDGGPPNPKEEALT